jgi:hypothetical protein
MKRDQFVDFFAIPAQQQEIHKRLENWARSLYSGGGGGASPMFRLYRAPEHWERESGITVDQHDAIAVGKGVQALPTPHRLALNWNYVQGGTPMKARREIGCTMEALMRYIVDARSMLIYRRV